jgi:23S rRNA (uracil1939-C5)-methyltransferase
VHDIDACPLAEAPLARAWASLRAAWGARASRLPGGRELRLTLRASAGGRVGLAVEHGRGRGAPEELLGAVTGLASVWGIDRAGRVRWQVGEPALAERWQDEEIPLAGLAFVQVNREAAAALDAHVGVVCGEAKPGRAVDAYCGFGLRALALARAGVETVGIDVDARAVAWANARAADAGLPARFRAARVERALATALPADVVVLNPPRAGVSREVAAALVRRPVGRVVYVSCNPATLGRDVRALSARYALVSCRAFDLFPQTAHVETVAVLERR